jgi:hypothetical protein
VHSDSINARLDGLGRLEFPDAGRRVPLVKLDRPALSIVYPERFDRVPEFVADGTQ